MTYIDIDITCHIQLVSLELTTIQDKLEFQAMGTPRWIHLYTPNYTHIYTIYSANDSDVGWRIKDANEMFVIKVVNSLDGKNPSTGMFCCPSLLFPLTLAENWF